MADRLRWLLLAVALLPSPCIAAPGNSMVRINTTATGIEIVASDPDGIASIAVSEPSGAWAIETTPLKCANTWTLSLDGVEHQTHAHNVFIHDCTTGSPLDEYTNLTPQPFAQTSMKRNSNYVRIGGEAAPSGMSISGPGPGVVTLGFDFRACTISTFPDESIGTLLAEMADSIAAIGGTAVNLDPDSLAFEFQYDNTAFEMGHTDSQLSLSLQTTDLKAVAPGQCATPSVVNLIGQNFAGATWQGPQGVTDGRFEVTVKDVYGELLSGVPVVLDLSQCPDLIVAAVQPPGVLADCEDRSAIASTGVDGIARYSVVGYGGPRTPYTFSGSAAIRAGAGGPVLGQPSVSVFDQDGVNGIGPNDFSLWLEDALSEANMQRSNFDGKPLVMDVDLPLLLAPMTLDPPAESGSHCDGAPNTKPVSADASGGLDLAWNHCLTNGGTTLDAPPCVTNSGSEFLCFSMKAPPGLTHLTAFEADVLFATGDPGIPLPGYWRFNTCHQSALFPDALGTAGCNDVFTNKGTYGAIVSDEGPGFERVRVLGGVKPSDAAPVAYPPGVEFGLFRMAIAHLAGAGSCAGCNTPIAIKFERLLLAQGGPEGPPDILLDQPAISRDVNWRQPVSVAGVASGEAQARFAVRRAPSSGSEIVVDCSLGKGAPAVLELFDVRGRRLAQQVIDVGDDGTRRVQLAPAGSLAPQLYFVRLSQGPNVATAKAAVLR